MIKIINQLIKVLIKKKCKTLNVVNSNKFINNSKRLFRFCSHIKNQKKYNSSKNSNKNINQNKYIDIDFKGRKVNHYLNFINNITIQNNNIIINNINENEKAKYNSFQNLNDKNKIYESLCQSKSNLIKRIPFNKKNNIYIDSNKNKEINNNSSSKYKKSKNCFEETIPHSNFKRFNYKHNSALYKNRTKPIIQIDKKIIKNSNNLTNISNNKIKKEKKGHYKSFSQIKNLLKDNSKYINLIKNIPFQPISNLERQLIKLKRNKKLIKMQFYNKEKLEYDQGLLTSKSNMISLGNEMKTNNTFRLNIKKIKKMINNKKNGTNLLKNSKIKKDLYESIIKNNKKSPNDINQNFIDYNFNIYNNKERRKDYLSSDIRDIIDSSGFISNEKKSIILSIEINKSFFSKTHKNNSERKYRIYKI